MQITEEKLKEILKEQREEYQKHLDGVVEDFKSHIKVLAETTGGLQEQLIALREMVAKNTEEITRLRIEMTAIRETTEIMRRDIEVIKKNLRVKVDLEEFAALEKRVAILESKR